MIHLQLSKLGESLQVFALIKSSDESSILKMGCMLMLRKNSFDRYLVHLDTVHETLMLAATEILELTTSKNANTSTTH